MSASWQSAGINADAAAVALYAVAAFIILLAIIIATVLLRRRGKGGKQSARRGNHRISVRDVIRVDERRRLVLVRRDNIEHLLLTGGDSDLVVESFPEGGEAAFEAGPLFSAREGRQPQKAAPALPQPPERQREGNKERQRESDKERQREGNKERERENAYTARPQRLPRQNAAEAADLPAEAAESAGRPRSPAPSYTPESRKAAERPAAAANGQSGHEPGRSENEAAREQPQSAEAERPAAARPAAAAAPQNAAGRPQAAAAMQQDNMPAANNRPAFARPAADNIAEREIAAARAEQSGRPAPRPAPAVAAYPQNIYAPRERSNIAAAPQPQPAGNKDNNAGFKRGGPLENSGEAQPGRAERPAQPPRPAPAAGAYAPYLGYMPKIAPQPAAAPQPPRGNNGAPQNAARSEWPAAENRDNAAFAPPPQREPAPGYGYGRGREAKQAAAPVPEREFSPAPAPQQPENMRGGPLRPQGWPADRRNGAPQNIYAREEPNGASQNAYAPRPDNGGGRDSAPLYPSFGGREEPKNKNGNGAAFNLNPAAGRKEFGPILPADDDDFDKILQDELLRAPNAIRFPGAPKK